MSASLVGSEMCIRDSRRPDSLGVNAMVMATLLTHAATVMVANVLVVTPVSYTHLTLPTICSV
eukprot:3598546-Alexandrium_andersonii.AAC.1